MSAFQAFSPFSASFRSMPSRSPPPFDFRSPPPFFEFEFHSPPRYFFDSDFFEFRSQPRDFFDGDFFEFGSPPRFGDFFEFGSPPRFFFFDGDFFEFRSPPRFFFFRGDFFEFRSPPRFFEYRSPRPFEFPFGDVSPYSIHGSAIVDGLDGRRMRTAPQLRQSTRSAPLFTQGRAGPPLATINGEEEGSLLPPSITISEQVIPLPFFHGFHRE